MIFVRNLLFYIIFYFWSALFFSILFPVKFFSRNFTFIISEFWTFTVVKLSEWILGIAYSVKGEENIPESQFILASKHQSAWETFFLPVLFTNSIFVLKKELDKIPILRGYFKKLGYIFVDKNSSHSSMRKLLTSAKNSIKTGIKTIMIFPEGTRVKINEKKDLNSGVYALYRSLNLPVLPITHNSGEFWINKKIIKKSGKINVTIFPPINPGLPKEDFMKKLTEFIR